MENKERHITNEYLVSDRFKNQFELVNYAIKLAENIIKTGREPRVAVDVQNYANQVLVEIETGNDIIIEVPIAQEEVAVAVMAPKKMSDEEEPRKNKKEPLAKMGVRKARKILVE